MLQTLSLRTTALATLMAIPATLVGTVAALAEDVTFPIRNETTASIIEFYISPTISDDWEENVVPPGGALAPGETVELTVDEGYPHCQYDMLAVFDDGIEVDQYDINICEIDTWVYSDE